MASFPGRPGLVGGRLSSFWILFALKMMEVVVTIGAMTCIVCWWWLFDLLSQIVTTNKRTSRLLVIIVYYTDSSFTYINRLST